MLTFKFKNSIDRLNKETVVYRKHLQTVPHFNPHQLKHLYLKLKFHID